MKGWLGHGHFREWVETEFGWSKTTAANMMNAASKCPDAGHLDIGVEAMYVLASPSTPEPIRQKFIESAKSGARITHKEVKAAIRVARKEAPTFQRAVR